MSVADQNQLLPGEPAPRSVRKVLVVLPAYKAAQTLEPTVAAVPADPRIEILLVDDASPDETFAVAGRMGIRAVRHDMNRGYGANQKTCYRQALASDADIVVMLHPDYQYDPRLIPAMVDVLRLNVCDVVLGNRVRSRKDARACGMPGWKYAANRFLTILENVVLGQNLGDFHSGFRAYAREVLERIPFEANSDDFVFDSQFLAQAAFFGFRIGDLPVPCRYFEEASSINFTRSLRYGLATVATLGLFVLAKLGLYRSKVFRR
jgi:glycosyltransferase involved in cell wall biosynthesis